MRKFALATGVASLLASASSYAAIDVTAVTTAIGDAAAPIATVAAAVLVLLAGVKAWKLIRRAM